MGYSKHPHLAIPDMLTPVGVTRPATAAPQIHAVERRLEPEVIAQIVAEYEAGAFTTQLTVRYNLGKGTLLRLLRRHGVTIRRQGLSLEEVTEACRLYEDGWSLAKIGNLFTKEHTVIRNALVKAGVKLRPRPGWHN